MTPDDLRNFEPSRKKDMLREVCKLDGFMGKQVWHHYLPFLHHACRTTILKAVLSRYYDVRYYNIII
jgi:hypothetical protein